MYAADDFFAWFDLLGYRDHLWLCTGDTPIARGILAGQTEGLQTAVQARVSFRAIINRNSDLFLSCLSSVLFCFVLQAANSHPEEGGDSRAASPHVILIGMRGAGKTTMGRELARRMKRSFDDLDEMAVQSLGMPIGDYVKANGW